VNRSLLRILGAGFGVSVVIGGTIGSGILRLPQAIATAVPDATLYLAVWIAGGAYALVCAPSFAELGAMSRRSGGLYVFTQRALGNTVGFLVGISDWIGFVGTIASLALFAAELIARSLPGLAGSELPVAIAMVIGFAAFQLLGIHAGSHAQIAMSAAKTFALVGLAIACLGEPAHAPAPATDFDAVLGFALAMKAVIFVYDGYYHAAYFAGELRDPGRDVPRTIVATLVTIIAIYVVLNLAYLHVLGIDGIAREPFAGGAFAQALFGDAGDRVITVIMLVTALGTMAENFLAAPRILHAMAIDGLLPGATSRVSLAGTPTTGLALTTAGALGFALSGTYERALAVVFFYVIANYALAFISVFALRRREPDAERPYRAWGYPYTTAGALAIALVLLVATIADDPFTAAVAAGLSAVAVAIRWTLHRFN
jgi:APA family basic amino acid/polyamine antiporter